MSVSNLTTLGIAAYKSRTLIPDHLFLEPRIYIKMERRFKGSRMSCDMFWVEISMLEQSHEVQQLFVLLILYLSMNTDRKC